MGIYLAEHPNVCFARPKEPRYFATDMNPKWRITTLRGYNKCFKHYDPKKHSILGEASTYLLSKEALLNIVKYNPNAKFIAIARNPVELVISLHSQHLKTLIDDEPDIKKAWDLQDERARGNKIPKYCEDASVLQYKDMASIGQRINEMQKIIPPQQQKVIIFDDLKNNPINIYKEILNFLNLHNFDKKEFPIVNAHGENRFLLLRKLYALLPYDYKAIIQRKISASPQLYVTVDNIVKKKIARNKVDSNFVDYLKSYFKDDVHLLSNILKKNLMYWVS